MRGTQGLDRWKIQFGRGVGQKSSCCFREVIKAAVKSTRWSRKDGVPELNESVTFQLLLYLDSVHMSINSNTVIES